MNEADVVHHLAGITNVARTKDEINELTDEEMNRVASKGTETVLSEISENCKIIFPSTHVVFEGLNKQIQIKSEELKGPNTISPDQAIEGFMRSNQIERKDLYKKKTIHIFL